MALVTSAIISYFAFPVYWFTSKKLLRAENVFCPDPSLSFSINKVKDLQQQMAELEKQDNDVYQTFCEPPMRQCPGPRPRKNNRNSRVRSMVIMN